jgi:hypothetical protein
VSISPVVATASGGAVVAYTASGLPAGVSLNGSTGVFAGSPATSGTYAVTVSVNVVAGASHYAAATRSFTLVVAKNPVSFTSVPSVSVDARVGEVVVIAPVAATAGDGVAVAYAASGLPAGVTLNGSTGVFSGAPSVSGIYTVTLTASAVVSPGEHGSPSVAFTLVVAKGTIVVSAKPAGSVAGKQGTAVSIARVVASASDGSPVVYAATGLPAGVTLNSSTGVFAGVPTVVGTFSVVVTVNAVANPGQYVPVTVSFSLVVASRVSYNHFSLSPDLNGDGRGEVLGVHNTGALHLHPATASGSLSAKSTLVASGVADRLVFGPGRWDADAYSDVITLNAAGGMFLHPGTGKGAVAAGKQIGSGWSGFTVVPAGDLTGDGKSDLLAINKSSGDMLLYAGNGTGGFKSPYPKVGNGWKGFNCYAAGDVNKDGKADILSVDSSGVLWLYAGNGNGTFKTRQQVGSGWGAYTLAAGGDLNGDGLADIAGRDDANGDLYFYKAAGGGKFATKVKIGTGW